MTTHDLTWRSWGHDYHFTPIEKGQRARMTVWNPNRIEVGDYLILPHLGGTTRYQVDSVERMSDPSDQMFLYVTFAPRTQETEEVRELQAKKITKTGFERQLMALDRNKLWEFGEAIIAMYEEYLHVHGYDKERAQGAAIMEVMDGTEAMIDLDNHGEL